MIKEENFLTKQSLEQAIETLAQNPIPYSNDIRNFATHIFTAKFSDGCKEKGLVFLPCISKVTLKCPHGIEEEFDFTILPY